MKPEIALPTALAAVRVAGPALLLFVAFTLLFIKPERSPKEPSPIVHVRVPVITPRRAAIFTLLSLAALSYVIDGTVVVLHAVLWHEWEGYDKQWRWIAEADIAGLLAFGGLLVIGTWKDAKGAPIWTCKRTKFFALIAVAFEIAQVALLALSLSKGAPSSRLTVDPRRSSRTDSYLISYSPQSSRQHPNLLTSRRTRSHLVSSSHRSSISASARSGYSSSSSSSLSSIDRSRRSSPSTVRSPQRLLSTQTRTLENHQGCSYPARPTPNTALSTRHYPRPAPLPSTLHRPMRPKQGFQSGLRRSRRRLSKRVGGRRLIGSGNFFHTSGHRRAFICNSSLSFA